MDANQEGTDLPRSGLDGRGRYSGTVAPGRVGTSAATAAKILGALLVAELTVLAVTGTYLFFRYRPAAAESWGEMERVFGRVPFEQRVRRWHRVTSTLTLWTVVAFAALWVARSSAARRVRAVVTGVGAIAGVAAASLTGCVLAWDQLALWAIAVGPDIAGYTWLWGDDVRFVLANGYEVSVRTFASWTAVHVALGVMLLGAIAWVLRPRRGFRPAATE